MLQPERPPASPAALLRQARLFERLWNASAAMLDAGSEAEVALLVLRAGMAAFDADAGFVALSPRPGAPLQVLHVARLTEPPAPLELAPDAPYPLAVAVRSGQALFIPSNEDLRCEHPGLVRLRGEDHACASIPLRVDDEVQGALNLSWDEPRAFDDDERALLEALGLHCAAAVLRVRETLATQETLRLHSAIAANMAEGACLVRVEDQVVVHANARFGELFGYPSHEVVGLALPSLLQPEQGVGAGDLLGDAARSLGQGGRRSGPGSWEGELRCARADGSLVWMRAHVSAFEHPEFGDVLVVVVSDVTPRRLAEERLRHLADHDPLTGLPNRRAFTTGLEAHVQRTEHVGGARGGAEPGGGCVLAIDLDEFKAVNDTRGHRTGDALIAVVAATLAAQLREGEMVARTGGDEFAALLPSASVAAAAAVAERLRRAVRDAAADAVPTGRRITASVGIAPVLAGASAEQLLVNADLAMYDAKEAGGDRFAVYDGAPGRTPLLQQRLGWLEQVEQALVEDGFVLHAQPVVDLHDGRVVSRELLLRMRAGAGRGEGVGVGGPLPVGEHAGETHEPLVPPAAFMPVAERYGLATRIDRWVAARAVDLLARVPGLHLSVNLSAQSLDDDRFAVDLGALLARHRVEGARLCVELTETAALSSMGLARQLTEQLRALGCELALDDFGAGFGSFAYLKHLPFDVIKIDGEFVRGAVGSRDDQLVIKAVVDVARGQGKRTVAEFVEDEATARLLRALGVDAAQGYHLGRPAPLHHG
ncbi:MAG: putative bifunctional diguanylate cyclase/phosphodiesterase [Motilibacteraceae bacterium]